MTFWLVVMPEANLNKAHQIMTYLSLLLFPTILSWLLTKLAEIPHDLTHQWEWNHICLAVRHYPRKLTKRRRQEDQARLRTKYKGRGPSYPLTSYRLP
jgi:hypothetical protein